MTEGGDANDDAERVRGEQRYLPDYRRVEKAKRAPRIMEYQFRKATKWDIPTIWKILQGAIARRKADGSNQWQDGYPNPAVIEKDIEKSGGHVLVNDNAIIGYCSVLINDEPAYADIKGEWLTNGDFIVFHRIAIAEEYLGKGFAKMMLGFIEAFALGKGIKSIRADTNHDNDGMLKIFKQLGFVYCGEVTFRGSARKAFEKVLE